MGGVDKDDDQLFDSDYFLSNSDDDDNSEEDATSSSPDASSPTPLPANMNPNGALYQLSSLLEHLPVKWVMYLQILSSLPWKNLQSESETEMVVAGEDFPNTTKGNHNLTYRSRLLAA